MKNKFLASLLGLILLGTASAQVLGFPDVSEDQWYYPYVMKIKDWNVVNGNDDGRFKPSANINRAEFSKMLVRYDERVDQKILNTVAEISKNEVLDPLKNNKKILPTIMHLDRDSAEIPKLCPEDWAEINYGRIYENVDNLNRRTCLTQKSCKVLVLRDRDKIPVVCPENWSEADFGRGKRKEQQRVCFICE